MIASLRKIFGGQSELALVLMLSGVLLILFAPIPPWLLDLLLITNFSCALLILLLTFYMGRPLEFSTFPSLLLVATLFRLGLNIAATRLILSQADAGHVIAAIGDRVVAGNYVIGLIVFVVLIVVQYVVVTNGAQRVAEVAARFTLDSMPGKQMSIDADLNMGLIDQNEARERRKQIEKEANFYGAMDGASRFVKGDAIAGIVIVLVNIIGGLTVGVAQMGMSWGEALQTYTLLTVGDGIVTQVPALIIATGTGIIVTRAASDARLGAEVSRQVLAYPKTIAVVTAALLLLAFLPGIPLTPVAILFIAAGSLYWYAHKRAKTVKEGAPQTDAKKSAETNDDLYKAMQVDPVEIVIGSQLIPLVGENGALLAERLSGVRKQYALDMGVVLPFVRVRDDKHMSPNRYEVRLFAARVADGEVFPDRLLAINPGGQRPPLEGTTAVDPAYGLPAVWIGEDRRQQARTSGYTVVDCNTVFMTHLGEVLKQNAHNLITRAETERLIARVREQQANLVDELVPKVLSLGDVQRVLQALTKERVPIRNIDAILEVLADNGTKTREPDALTEHVRERLAPVICQQCVDGKGELHVLTFDPQVEQTLSSAVRAVDDKATLVIEPKFAEQVLRKLAEEADRMSRGNVRPVLLCAPTLRRHVRRFTERMMPQLTVLSLNEITGHVNLRAYGVVKV